MQINPDPSWAGITGLIAALGSIGAFFGFAIRQSHSRGIQDERIRDMGKRVDDHAEKLGEIKQCADEAYSVSKVLATDIVWIKEALTDIKGSIKEIRK
jgi:hypothetical protein